MTLDPVFYKTAAHVAEQYGFSTLEDLQSRFPSASRKLASVPASDRKIDSLNGELVRSIKSCLERDMITEGNPALFYTTTLPKTRGVPAFGLQAIGIKQGIAETTVLKTSAAILDELKVPYNLYINTIGDKDSAARFKRETTNFLKKHMDEFSPVENQLLKDDPIALLAKTIQKNNDLKLRAPKPLEFLSKDSRRHFREVLEHLESINMPYDIDDMMLADSNCYAQTVFEIRKQSDSGSENVIARGGRFDQLGQKLFKVHAPAVGIVFNFVKNACGKALPKIRRKPVIGFVHLGADAEKKSFRIVESLRRAHVPIVQKVGPVPLSGQLQYVKERSVKYTIIIGQREANENTVIVRDMETSAQNVIDENELINYIKVVAK